MCKCIIQRQPSSSYNEQHFMLSVPQLLRMTQVMQRHLPVPNGLVQLYQLFLRYSSPTSADATNKSGQEEMEVTSQVSCCGMESLM